jgi:hypothetical protein
MCCFQKSPFHLFLFNNSTILKVPLSKTHTWQGRTFPRFQKSILIIFVVSQPRVFAPLNEATTERMILTIKPQGISRCPESVIQKDDNKREVFSGGVAA